MSYFFSDTTGSFYPADPENPDQIHPAYKDVPNDLIAVDEDTFKKAIEARSHGASLSVSDGVLDITPVDPEVISAQLLTQQKSDYKAQAKSLLAKSDLTVMRCYEAGIALPTDWVAARKSWRAVVGTAIDSIDPTQPLAAVPPYPEGA